MNKIKKNIGDSVIINKSNNKQQLFILHETIENNLNKNKQTLLLGEGRTDFFVTEDSRKYILKKQQLEKQGRYVYVDSRGYFDSLHIKYVRTYSARGLQQKRIIAEFRNVCDIAQSFKIALELDLSPIRMWKVSLAGAVLFGMVSMSMIYKNLGQSAMATGSEIGLVGNNNAVELVEDKMSQTDSVKKKIQKKTKEIKQEKIDVDNIKGSKQKQQNKIKEAKVDSVQKNISIKERSDDDNIDEKVKKIQSIEKKVKQSVDSAQRKHDNKTDAKKEEYSLERNATKMVDGYPIEKMLPYILKQDPEVAKYLIAIAKQESQWGKRVPVLNGQDCYNYWGFRAKRKLMGSGGHTCFNSRKDAVETVGKRIHELIYKYDRKTANRLIVWKCGNTCKGHSQAGVDRWISTVSSYYNQLSQ